MLRIRAVGPTTTRGASYPPVGDLDACPRSGGGGGGAQRRPLVRGGICVAVAEANRWPLRVGRWIQRERNKWSLIKRGSALEGQQTVLRTSTRAGLRTAATPTVRALFAPIAFEFGVHPRHSKLISCKMVSSAAELPCSDICRFLWTNYGLHPQTLTAGIRIFTCIVALLLHFREVGVLRCIQPTQTLGPL